MDKHMPRKEHLSEKLLGGMMFERRAGITVSLPGYVNHTAVKHGRAIDVDHVLSSKPAPGCSGQPTSRPKVVYQTSAAAHVSIASFCGVVGSNLSLREPNTDKLKASEDKTEGKTEGNHQCTRAYGPNVERLTPHAVGWSAKKAKDTQDEAPSQEKLQEVAAVFHSSDDDFELRLRSPMVSISSVKDGPTLHAKRSEIAKGSAPLLCTADGRAMPAPVAAPLDVRLPFNRGQGG